MYAHSVTWINLARVMMSIEDTVIENLKDKFTAKFFTKANNPIGILANSEIQNSNTTTNILYSNKFQCAPIFLYRSAHSLRIS